MANRIPRNACKMNVILLTDTTAGNAGTVLKAEKNEFGTWIGKTKEGKSYSLFIGHLRNSDLCQIEIVA